jgi:hypothetical protein
MYSASLHVTVEQAAQPQLFRVVPSECVELRVSLRTLNPQGNYRFEQEQAVSQLEHHIL